jgi:hypothetical protein
MVNTAMNNNMYNLETSFNLGPTRDMGLAVYSTELPIRAQRTHSLQDILQDVIRPKQILTHSVSDTLLFSEGEHEMKNDTAATEERTARKAEFEKNLQDLRDSVESLDAAKTETIGSPSIGDVVRQGDLYLVNIEKLPEGKKLEDRQLAEGNTQGSRHIVQGDVTLVSPNTAHPGIDRVLCGPAFHCNEAAEVTHPEHGNKILPKDTTWRVTFQRAHAEEMRRVQD